MVARKDRLSKEINAFMGSGSEFEGKLNFTGSVRLDGKVTGEIESQGLLIIGPQGDIQADVKVETIIICGVVRGDIIANQKIELKAPAKVYGTLTTPNLIIHDGVIFEGACQMTETSIETAMNKDSNKEAEKENNISLLSLERGA